MAGSALAAAVAGAGGVGALALTWTSPDNARRLVASLAAKRENVFQGNFVLAFPPTSLCAALEAGLRMVSFSWGLPSTETVRLVRSFGARIGVQVTHRDGARRALDLGADVLICQGVEAGGHVQASRSLWDVLSSIVAEAEAIAVIAAGGIASGAAIARALGAGASGAMLGTRFVATTEALAHDMYKRRLVEARATDTALTVCFDGGWPYAAHRVLRNTTLDAWEAAGCPPPGQRPGEGEIVGRLPDGATVVRYDDMPPRVGVSGSPEAMTLYAGLGCDEIRDIPHASDLVARLWRECQEHQSSCNRS